MKNIYENVLPAHRWMLMMKMFILIAGLGWLVTAVLFHGHAAASEKKAPAPASSLQAGNADMQDNGFDTSAVPEAHEREWAGIQNKLAKEYDACIDDCGDHLECQEKCWKVYEFRLNRELRRIMQKAQ
jgi:hypothetical protein